MTKRATLDNTDLSVRVREYRPRQTANTVQALNTQRHQRQLARRASMPKRRQPRVRLGEPTPHNAYVHWQDYLDISDLHKQPKVPAQTSSRLDVNQHETVSEMLNRYKHYTEEVVQKVAEVMKPSEAAFEEAEESD